MNATAERKFPDRDRCTTIFLEHAAGKIRPPFLSFLDRQILDKRDGQNSRT
jgi:hypothetical protein